MLCTCGNIDNQLHITRQARVFVQARLSEHYRQHLLVGQVVSFNLLCHCFGPAQASDSELYCNWHNSKLSVQNFGLDLLRMRSTVPISPRHRKESSRQFVLASFQCEEFVLCEASILSCKCAQSRQQCAFYGCLEHIALELEIHLRFPELTQHAPHPRSCSASCFPLCGERQVPG